MRNPWGEGEWTGAWGDNDKRWTPELNAKLNHTKEDDGTFFMCFEDFHKIYNHTLVCKVNDRYIHSYLEVNRKSAVCVFSTTS